METNISDISHENCPIRHVLDVIADKWASLIVYALQDRPLRFAALQKHTDVCSVWPEDRAEYCVLGAFSRWLPIGVSDS